MTLINLAVDESKWRVPTAWNGSITETRTLWSASPSPSLASVSLNRFFVLELHFLFPNSQRYESIFIFSLKFAHFLFIDILISGIESLEYGRRDPSRWPCCTLYPKNLALTSPGSRGRSVGIVFFSSTHFWPCVNVWKNEIHDLFTRRVTT
jgi:hypothetical protein